MKRTGGPDDDGRNIEDYFKDPNNTYRIFFATAMWMTGYDAPSVSTLYLDKPLQNHSLMQAIARANRVIEGKKNGLVVDYFGVFRNLKIALAAYAEGTKGKESVTGNEDDQYPAKEFEKLLTLLQEVIAEAKTKLDFALLRREFPEKPHKNIQFADLRELIRAEELRRKKCFACFARECLFAIAWAHCLFGLSLKFDYVLLLPVIINVLCHGISNLVNIFGICNRQFPRP
jgi:type I site-specific restriction-modification system R (restriction) subunit